MNASILILGAVLNLGLGVIVLLRAKERTLRILFFLLTLSLVLWSVFNYFSVTFPDPIITLWAMRTVMFFAVAQTVFFLFFVVSFPEGKFDFKPKLLIPYLILVGITSVVVFTPLMFSGVTISGDSKSPQVDKGMVLFLITAVGSVLAGLILLIKKYKKADDTVKSQIKFLLIGVFLMFFLMILFNLVLVLVFKVSSFVYLGTYFVLPFVGFTTYSIVSKKMFDLKVIITEFAVFLVATVMVVQTLVAISSRNGNQVFINSIILLAGVYGGYILINSVKQEIKRREEIQKLAKDLEAANDHLKELDKLKDDFLSMASHELNTPIAAIEGYLSMVLVEGMGGKIPDKARGYLETVFTSSQRLAHMVKDLLNVSRIESGRIHIIWEQKPIEDVIKQAVTEVMSKAREAKHTLSFEEPKKPMPKTWFDVTRITEILINMLGNSIKYTDPGGKITVRCHFDDDKIVVEVEDNGKGIPKERTKAVFEKFTQVDVMKDEVKGTGLGMYIAKKFIELHKGQIWFHSDGAGKGTTFFFSLPILKEKPFDEHEGEDAVLH